ncbi:MAG: FG-GAP-like repeat-containing protein, partial [Planctomycetota bacterium]
MRTKHFSCLCVVVCCFLIGSASAVDFGDAPSPYPVTLIEDGARHEAIGPRLGDTRDSESDGTHSADADADDTTGIDDEDGASFGIIQTGQLGASVTVNVQNAPGGAKLDAWIDFNGDGCWGGPFEQIADNVTVADGNNIIIFDVPSWAVDGPSYARLRLSTAGDLAPGGSAADGEVEDYQVTITAPTVASGLFGSQNVITTDANFAYSVFAADVDSDGDMDVLSASWRDAKIAWYENHGSENFTAHSITEDANGAMSVFAADVDGDGDMDVLSASAADDTIAWYEN